MPSVKPDDRRCQQYRQRRPRSGRGRCPQGLQWDAARFVGHMKPFRQARPHWDFAAELLLKAAATREDEDIEAATAQMERALLVEGWL